MIASYGDVDELNSMIGLLASNLEDDFPKEKSFLEDLQNQLFNLGSLLSTPSEKRTLFKIPLLREGLVASIEREIDLLDSALPKLKTFILPGGGASASLAHLCRVITRRVERDLMTLREKESDAVTLEMLSFMNRLSDYFFALARWLNFEEGIAEKTWKKS